MAFSLCILMIPEPAAALDIPAANPNRSAPQFLPVPLALPERNAARPVTASVQPLRATQQSVAEAPARTDRRGGSPGIALPERATRTPPRRSAALTRKEAENPSPAPSVAGATETVPDPLTEWPVDEVAAARTACDRLLAGLGVVYEAVQPIRKGPCGTPAPIRVRALGKTSQIQVRPAAIMNCEMAARLAEWVDSDLQPLALATFDSPVRRIANYSDYSCRFRNRASEGKLSEHGRANALDIGYFVLADGRRVDLKKDWGPTERDLVALEQSELERAARRATAAQEKAEQRAAERKLEAEKRKLQAWVGSRYDAGGHGLRPILASRRRGRNHAIATPVDAPLPNPRRLSGERNAPPVELRQVALDGDAETAVVQWPTPNMLKAREATQTQDAKFLRAAHASACSRFGTVLGPEANDAHRNHFHVDLAPRRGKAYCE